MELELSGVNNYIYAITYTKNKQKMNTKKLKLFVLALIAISIAFILSSCGASQSAVSYHQGLQRELTFDNAVKNLEAFTAKSAKEDNSALKKELKEVESQKKGNSKRKSIEEENAELRAKIEEAKKNN